MHWNREELNKLLTDLHSYQGAPDVFNPWRDYDPLYDKNPNSPAIRLKQLQAYLAYRINHAQFILVAEAVSYQGGKFSGIPMTSERILLGNQREIVPTDITPNFQGRRTSLAKKAVSKTAQRLGYGEPTATIVWGMLQDLSLEPEKVLLWNIFPFHPFHSTKGPLSNRTPRQSELREGLGFLEQLVSIASSEIQIIAVGRKSATTLGGGYPMVRHPAQGGARLFREQLPTILGIN